MSYFKTVDFSTFSGPYLSICFFTTLIWNNFSFFLNCQKMNHPGSVEIFKKKCQKNFSAISSYNGLSERAWPAVYSRPWNSDILDNIAKRRTTKNPKKIIIHSLCFIWPYFSKTKNFSNRPLVQHCKLQYLSKMVSQ